jgi:hypothetical protein
LTRRCSLFERIVLRSDLLLSHLPSAYERFFSGAGYPGLAPARR